MLPLSFLLLLVSPLADVAGLPDAVRPLDRPAPERAVPGVDVWGTDEALWTDDSEVDPFAAAPDLSGGEYGGEAYGGDYDVAGRSPRLPGPPTPIPADGGLALLALAGGLYAARRLRSPAAGAAAGTLVVLAVASPAGAQALSPGDVAIVAFDTNFSFNNGGDGFKAVALVDLPAGAVVKFTDRGWTAAGAFRAATGTEQEGTTTFTAPAGGVAAGTVLTYRDDGTGTTAGFSPATRAFGATDGLTSAGDQILVYQGDDAAPVFIYGVTHNGGAATGWNTDATSALTSARPRNLDDGSTACPLTFRNSPYKGVSVGNRGTLLAAIGTLANWPGSNTLNTVSSNTTAVPTVYVVSATVATPGTATLVGGEGWRLLAIPTNTAAGVTVADLAALNLVQGLADEYPSVVSNIYTGYNGYNADSGDPDGTGPRRPNNLGFVAPFTASDATPNTQKDVVIRGSMGFIWYLYDRPFGPFATGTSRSRALPLQLPMLGTEVSTTRTLPFTTADRTPASASPGAHDGFYLIGNSFRQALDLSGISLTAGTGTLQATFQFWNPNSGVNTPYGADPGNGTPGSYVVRTATADVIATANSVADDAQVWQGFFAEIVGGSASTPPTFSFDAAFRVASSDPTFYGRGAAGGSGPDSVWTAAFTVAGVSESGYGTYDEAAVLRFSPDAALEWDAYEASKIDPFGALWATLSPIGPGYDGAPVRLAQRSLPFRPDGPLDVPLAFTAAGEGGQYTLAWSLQNVPAGWSLSLLDTEAGTAVDLQADSSYAFTSDIADTERFVLTVTPGNATSGASAPEASTAEVGRFFPNPTAGAARVHVRTGPGGPLRATLFDALGRRVQTVFDGPTAAGAALDLAVETAGLARGVYVLRVDGAGVSESRRLTVVR